MNTNMRYRAIGDREWEGKPLQAMGNCLNRMRDWARAMADKTSMTIRIYETGETVVDTVEPTPVPETKPVV